MGVNRGFCDGATRQGKNGSAGQKSGENIFHGHIAQGYCAPLRRFAFNVEYYGYYLVTVFVAILDSASSVFSSAFALL